MWAKLAAWGQEMAGGIFRAFLNLVFPPRCLVCGDEGVEASDGVWICQSCRQRVFPVDRYMCTRCAVLVPAGKEAADPCPFVAVCHAVWMP